MIKLVPSWAHHYDAFWDAIKRRNLWFIKLRYGAVLMLIALEFSSRYLLQFKYTASQYNVFIFITLFILFYNAIFHLTRKHIKNIPGKFNPLHFSLLQMLLDLSVLMLLIYYTGGVESPLTMLFIFHIIIGSLILPGYVIYTLTFCVIGVYIFDVSAEYIGLISHHHIDGFLTFHLHNNFNFIVIHTSVFAFVLLMSVLLANRIAKQLYQMEQELVEYLDKLDAAEKEKQKYIMGVVH